jgi:hypothetical protein
MRDGLAQLRPRRGRRVGLGNGTLERGSGPDDRDLGFFALAGLLDGGFLDGFTHSSLLV